MIEWTSPTDLWEFVSRDVAIVGGLQSPMLSWIGAGGILAISCWHAVMLLRGLRRIRQTLSRFHSSISTVLSVRQRTSKDWLVVPVLTSRPPSSGKQPESRRDLDDLQALDRAVRSEQVFAGEWLAYRKSLAIEQSAWFLEPTVYSQRSAAEFFSFDSLCSGYVNVRFFRQLPSFLIGMGLLFTFLAILIGLSKLHATGSQIEGIQGLINGLSGKFVTSIIGLACANAFAVLENSIWHRLENRYRACIALLDDMFPQKAVDQSIRTVSSPNRASASTATSPFQSEDTKQLIEVVQKRLGATADTLTSASKALTAVAEKQLPSKQDELARQIGHEVQRALKPMMNSLVEAIHSLNRVMKEQPSSIQLSPLEIETLFEELKSHPAEAQKNTFRSQKEGKGNRLASRE